MSSSSHRSFKSGGGGGPKEDKPPKFNTVSPSAGQAYVQAAQKYCLLYLSEVVSTFCRGVLPIEMLEHPLAFDRRNMIGRKAGKYNDSEGKLMVIDQSVSSWRAQLIVETQAANKNCSEEDALTLLFPKTGGKSRENKRQLFATQSLQLLNNLNMLWPSEAMILEMDRNKGLRDATNSQDLIAWENAFISFCLDNCGNADMNVKAAEDTLESAKMKGMDLASYVKSFRTASENCKRCKSTFTEKRIVEIFIRNLNQDADAFFRFSSKILDSSDSLFSLTSTSLEAAISYVEKFHKTVIVPELANKRIRDGQSSSIKNLSDLRNLVSSTSAGQVSVPVTILATMMNNNNINNSNKNKGNEAESKKRKAEAAKEEARKKTAAATAKASKVNNANTDIKAETADVTSGTSKTKTRVCYKFRDDGKCSYGDKCYFSHA
jgi:hypothetical protein